MDTCSVFVQNVTGLDDIRLECSLDTAVADVLVLIRSRVPSAVADVMAVTTRGGLAIGKHSTLRELCGTSQFVNLTVRIPLCGGKGGFGHMLKTMGRSSRKRKSDKSSSRELCRTLDGRRVKTIRRLRLLEAQMGSLPEKERAKLAERRAKLQKIIDLDPEKNVKFEDSAFLEDIDKQLEEIRGDIDVDVGDHSDSDTGDESGDDSEPEPEPETKPSKAKFQSFFDNKAV